MGPRHPKKRRRDSGRREIVCKKVGGRHKMYPCISKANKVGLSVGKAVFKCFLGRGLSSAYAALEAV